MAAWFQDSSEGAGAFWASVFVLCGIPGSWRFWYRSIYFATRDDSNRNWVFFFFFFFLHGCFSIIMGLGVPSTYGAGLFYMLKEFTNSNHVIGMCGLVATTLWGLNVFFCLILIKMAYSTWRSSGGEKRLAQDVTKEVISSQVNSSSGYGELKNEPIRDDNI